MWKSNGLSALDSRLQFATAEKLNPPVRPFLSKQIV